MNNKGAVLILVVVCLVVPLLIIGGVYCHAVIQDAHLTRYQLDLQKANFLAEAGIERAALRIKTNNIVAVENFQLSRLPKPIMISHYNRQRIFYYMFYYFRVITLVIGGQAILNFQ